MEKKKYELVAWTRNLEGRDTPEIRMIPSLHHEMQEPYYHEIEKCQEEEKRSGGIDEELARRFIRVYEQAARYMFRTGYYGDGLRFLRNAAFYCIWSDDNAWVYWDTDLGSYTYFCGRLRGEFLRLCRELIALAERYQRYDILTEDPSRDLLEIFREQTREERDLARHLDEMKPWK